ncbi:MAG: type II secretion system minor pseudopilin GspJ [Proteobacteria bacterium]|nr:type II secretion system minor pseudopilin GspJ [Pseudomonadota bacterium]MDA0993855.1 type II secretion system minor pseudopilin GspJ [Pseudomonadota bacterium]
MIRRNAQKGFTLIEVLVAMAIFAILSALAYGTLNQTLLSADILSSRMDRLQALQRTMRMLTDDLYQLSPRPVRDELGDNYAPALSTGFQSGFAIELTRSGWNNPMVLPRSTMQRAAYRIEDEELVRYHWMVLDRTLSNDPVSVVLLDGIESIQFRFVQANGEFTDQWPPLSQSGPTNLRMRPRAVEITLRLADEGEIVRLVEVAP